MTWIDTINDFLSGPIGIGILIGVALLIIFVAGAKSGYSLSGFIGGLGKGLGTFIDYVSDSVWERVLKGILWLVLIFVVAEIAISILITQVVQGGDADIWYVYRTLFELFGI